MFPDALGASVSIGKSEKVEVYFNILDLFRSKKGSYMVPLKLLGEDLKYYKFDDLNNFIKVNGRNNTYKD